MDLYLWLARKKPNCSIWHSGALLTACACAEEVWLTEWGCTPRIKDGQDVGQVQQYNHLLHAFVNELNKSRSPALRKLPLLPCWEHRTLTLTALSWPQRCTVRVCRHVSACLRESSISLPVQWASRDELQSSTEMQAFIVLTWLPVDISMSENGTAGWGCYCVSVCWRLCFQNDGLY